jgi:18S rRNA (guanine1575-N7)-methyltransferase
MELITASALRCGFTGGLVVDYPNSTKAKKYFLCLFAGVGVNYSLPAALGTEEPNSVTFTDRYTV